MTFLPQREIDYEQLILEDRVHGRLYYDPDVFRDEIDNFWHQGWVYVGHESEVSEPGDYRSKSLGLQPVIMTRDEDGQVHVLMNRCPHRGNLICQSERGSSHYFRCAYHGWTYSNRGGLIGVPFVDAFGPSFQRQDFQLTSAPRVASYRGFVFGSLSPTGISLDEHLGRAKALIDQASDLAPDGAIELRAGAGKHKIRANWKMIPENLVDGYHFLFVHHSAVLMNKAPGVNPAVTYGNTPDVIARELGDGHLQIDSRERNRKLWAKHGTDLGPTRVRTFLESKKDDAWISYVQLLEERLGKDRAQQVLGDGQPIGYIFPNLILIHYQVRVLHPVSPGETYFYYYPSTLKGAPEPINVRRVREQNSSHGPAGFVSPDDVDIYERTQAALEAKVNEWQALRRGLHRERVDTDGLHMGEQTDEALQRAFWRNYKRRLSGVTQMG